MLDRPVRAGASGPGVQLVARLKREVVRILRDQHGDEAPPLPSDRMFYRLVSRLSRGKHTFGSARTRKSAAKPPVGPFGLVTASRPGEWMQIDSTPIDVRVVLDTGLIDRAELTGHRPSDPHDPGSDPAADDQGRRREFAAVSLRMAATVVARRPRRHTPPGRAGNSRPATSVGRGTAALGLTG